MATNQQIVRLGLNCLSIDSGTYRNPQGTDIPAVSVNVNHMNRTVSISMTASDARALAELLYQQADRAEEVTLGGTGKPGKN